MRWVLAINSVATWWKLVIPIATIFVLMAYSFHPGNMVAHAASVPISGVFTAVATAGIVFSFLGFQQAISLAGETRNPSRYIPLALIGSVLVGMLIYVGLQFAFITALDPRDISGGWQHLRFTGMFGPLAAIAIGVGAFWWAVVLYADAFVSPLGTAFIYVTASPRIIMAAGEMGSAPEQVVRLNRNGVPWVGLVVTYVVGVVFFFPFPSWQKLVSADSLIMVLAYAMAPVTLLHLRGLFPMHRAHFACAPPACSRPSPSSRPTGSSIGRVTRWSNGCWVRCSPTRWCSSRGIFVAGRRAGRELGWQQAWWIAPYLAGIWIVSYLGPADMGGQGKLGFFTGMWILAAFSLIILYLALKAGTSAAVAQAYADRVKSLASSGADPLTGAEEAASA